MIADVSADGLSLTTVDTLEYEHKATVFTEGGVEFEMRGEVALLTRNVKVNGQRNTQFDYEIDKCDRDFDSGKKYGNFILIFLGMFHEYRLFLVATNCFFSLILNSKEIKIVSFSHNRNYIIIRF